MKPVSITKYDKYNKLTYLYNLEKRNKRGEILGKWLCDCGKMVEIRNYDAKSGSVKSCGCSRKEKGKKNIVFGTKFNRLSFVENTEKKENRAFIGLWKCECGNTIERGNTWITKGYIKSCGCLNIDKIKSRNGANHPNWKGGLTEASAKIRKSSDYKKWRALVFERDVYTCKKCYKTNMTLNADHILPFALFPELIFSLKNGRTLCEDCHKKNTYLWFFTKKNNKRRIFNILNMETTFEPKNIIKPNTPRNLNNIGTGILMFTSGMIPIVQSLPLEQTAITWIIGLLNASGLGVKIITMMFGTKIQAEDNKQNTQINQDEKNNPNPTDNNAI